MTKWTEAQLFIVGTDEFNSRTLETIAGKKGIRLHPLLPFRQLQGPAAIPVEEALDRCRGHLASSGAPPDGIAGYWDFPVTEMVPLLCRDLGLPGPTLESVLRCEHKIWSRIEAQAVVPEHVPAFRAVDPFDDAAVAAIDLPPPYWIKPIRSTDSQLAFRIASRRDLARAIGRIREEIGRFSGTFDHLLGLAELPEDIRRINGRFCIVEQSVSGRQCTVEGHVHGGRTRVRGVVDSFRYPGSSSFFRYQYPSRLPRRIRSSLAEISERVVERTGLDDAAWNIEFFVDENTGRIWLLEINPRISQSHAHLFEMVDGTSNLEAMMDLALGSEPGTSAGGGPYACAAKFYVRMAEDAGVSRVPTRQEVETLERRFPGTRIHITAEEGKRLSEHWGQDSYSFRLADVHMAARNTGELLRNFRRLRQLLPFELSPERKKRRAAKRRATERAGAAES